ARLYLVKANIHIARTELDEVLDACINGLQMLDVNVPRKGGNLRVFIEFLRTNWYLRGKSLQDLNTLPEWEGPAGKYMGELLYLSLHPTYVSSPALYGTFCLKTLQVSLKKGVSTFAHLGFSTYGIFLGVGFNQFEKAHRFMEIGGSISERLKDQNSTSYSSRAFSKSFGGRMRDGFPWFEKAFRYSDERGLYREATEPLTLYGINQYHAGVPLDQVAANLRKYLSYARKSATEHLYNSILVVYYNVLRMQGRTDVILRDAKGGALDASRMQKILFETNYLTIRAYHNFMQMQQAYLLGESDRAYTLLKATLPIAHSVAGAFTSMEISFYHGLILASRLHASRGWRRRKFARQLRKIANKIGKWAQAAPANYAHREKMLRAELAFASGNTSQALALLDQAIAAASKDEFFQNAAIAQERAGQICLAQGKLEQAASYLNPALQGYQSWGAALKVQQMYMAYQLHLQAGTKPAILSRQQASSPLDTSPDVISLLKASRIISGEISLRGLLARLIRILIENAGAERGVLLIESEGELHIQVSGTANQEAIEIQENEEAEQVPRSIINFVSRSRKALLLDDAMHDPEFGHDPYIQEFQPRSVLCHPIVNQSKLSGILYLENNLTTGGFTRERLAVLDILAAQAAISIENALLYEDLEERVEVRTRELKKTLRFLQTTQDQLVQAEKLASLGQVTAGIAHEIRNPLNFVNNFSELSMELAEELEEVVAEIQDGTLKKATHATIQEYLEDLKNNAEKIRRHGKRAESIVQNMLLHAASGTGEQQWVDFNKLTKEYVLLAYHGIRGQKATFSCTIEFDLDEAVGKIQI
ncbi:MAG TPA: GAF domain-containing protein, partial [Bacteroidetes bacterium]|nr:GAF domain-containing protein [Bacteroidota bacterium]